MNKNLLPSRLVLPVFNFLSDSGLPEGGAEKSIETAVSGIKYDSLRFITGI